MVVLEQYRAAVIAVAVVVLLGLGALAGAGAAYWLLSRRQPPHAVEESLRDFARFFEKGLLNWREDAR